MQPGLYVYNEILYVLYLHSDDPYVSKFTTTLGLVNHKYISNIYSWFKKKSEPH